MSGPRATRILALWIALAAVAGCGGGDGSESSFTLAFRIDETSAVRAGLERTRTLVSRALDEGGVPFASLEIDDDSAVIVRGMPAASLEPAQAAVRQAVGDWIVEAASGGSLRVSPPADLGAFFERARARTLKVLDARLRGLDMQASAFEPGSEPGTLRVHLAGPRSPGVVTELLGATTSLEWCEIRFPSDVADPATWIPPGSREGTLALFGGALPADTVLIPQTIEPAEGRPAETVFWPVRVTPLLTGDDVVEARAIESAQSVARIELELTPAASTRFERITREIVGSRMAIVLRDRNGEWVRSAPVIREPILSHLTIAGGMTIAEARGLAIVLASGELPARVEFVAVEP